MPIRRTLAFCMLLWCLATSAKAAEIVLGIEPFFNPRTLATAFKSVRDFLSERSGAKVVATTAANYEQFMQQWLNGEFDMVLAGPNLSLLAAQKAGYQQLFRCATPLRIDLVVEGNSPYQTPQDLADKVVALPNAWLLDAMLGAEFFRPPFTQQPVAVNFRHNDYTNSATLMMLRGEAAAAAVNHDALLLMSPQIRDEVRVIAQSKPYGSMMVMTHPRMTAERRSKLRDALIEFLAGSDPKRNIFSQVCRPSDKLLGEQEMQQLAPYVESLRRSLGK